MFIPDSPLLRFVPCLYHFFGCLEATQMEGIDDGIDQDR